MTKNKRTYYANHYSLESYLQSQQNIPHKYNPKDYLGGCMYMQEEQHAEFLSDFVNDIAIILPEHYDLMECILHVSKNSGNKAIKAVLPLAIQKFDILQKQMLRQREIAARIKPINFDKTGSARYSILESKRKMLTISYSNLRLLEDAIKNEHSFNTTRQKQKFAALVSYRIDLVLSGKLPIDSDFSMLLKRYGTPYQIKRYSYIVSNRNTDKNSEKQKPAKKQQVKTTTKQPAKKPIVTATKNAKPIEKSKEKTSGFGFFKKIGQTITKIAKKAKKPLLWGGILALSVFGGKRLHDAVVEQNDIDAQTQYDIHYTPRTTPKIPVLNVTDTVPTRSNNSQQQQLQQQPNQVLNKAIKQLQYLKENNPTDRNMDVQQTANRLYQKFGDNASKVILVSAMTPYALNQYTNFDFRPTTHNLIEYLSTHELTPEQKSALNEFISQHTVGSSINPSTIAAYNMQNQR